MVSERPWYTRVRDSLNPWHRKRLAPAVGSPDEHCLSPPLDDVKIKFIGRESSVCPRYSQSKDDYLDDIIAYLEEDTYVPEDSIPYIDEEDEVYIAAQLARRQSLVRRVSTLMSRKFASMSGRSDAYECTRVIYI